MVRFYRNDLMLRGKWSNEFLGSCKMIAHSKLYEDELWFTFLFPFMFEDEKKCEISRCIPVQAKLTNLFLIRITYYFYIIYHCYRHSVQSWFMFSNYICDIIYFEVWLLGVLLLMSVIMLVFRCYLQKRVLNSSKGPAVRALRAQTDKREYALVMKNVVERQVHIHNFSPSLCYFQTPVSIFCCA